LYLIDLCHVSEPARYDGTVLKQGIMSKRAQQKRRITLLPNVKERWFLLTTKSLFYFEIKNGEKGKLKGTVALDSVSAVEPLPAAEGSLCWVMEVWSVIIACVDLWPKIVHAAAILYCQTFSREDRDAWVVAIRGASPKIAGRKTPQTPRGDAPSVS
jgi:hypothetical protein